MIEIPHARSVSEEPPRETTNIQKSHDKRAAQRQQAMEPLREANAGVSRVRDLHVVNNGGRCCVYYFVALTR